jgi:hypothetical protein
MRRNKSLKTFSEGQEVNSEYIFTAKLRLLTTYEITNMTQVTDIYRKVER